MAELPDANFWLALAWEGHASHVTAKAWWQSHPQNQIVFCRVTQMALLRLLTNRAILRDEAKTQAGAWGVYEALRGSPRVEFFTEPPDFLDRWKQFSSRDTSATQKWTDDYLAAFAVAHGLNVVTFDDGFKTYSELKVELLVQAGQTS